MRPRTRQLSLVSAALLLSGLMLAQEMWLSLSVTVIGGLVVVTFLALLIVPCLYLLTTGEPAAVHQPVPEAGIRKAGAHS